jgi:molybdopterin/thiamine biosynthesis adenylyltransferase
VKTGGEAFVLADSAAARIRAATAPWGQLKVGFSEPDHLIGVTGAGERTSSMYDTGRADLAGHVLSRVDHYAGGGVWYRARPELHEWHAWLIRTGHAIPAGEFRKLIIDGWRQPPADAATPVITHVRGAEREWAAWSLSRDCATAAMITVLRPPGTDPLAGLPPAWPLHDMAAASVAVIGAGSIGSAAAHALAMYGTETITLVDDDRLLWHNLARHQGSRADIGRYKVDAVADAMTSRWPGTTTEPLRLNVISDADQMRPLFDHQQVILCAADGVSPRRVVSHLARRAGKTAVLACVLLDGAVGEVLRLRPWPGHGCLLCQRQQLIAQGSIDPEPALDLGYGTGNRHRPMTAVGSDLVTVGQLAAKLAVATILEAAGHYDQVITGDYAIAGLRRDLSAASPFDVEPGQVRWLPAAPQQDGCPTCGAP